MTCYHPLNAFYPLECASDGKRYLKFGNNKNKIDVTSTISLHHQGIISDTEFWSGLNPYSSEYEYPVYFDKNDEINGVNIRIPCGKCIGCRLDYSRSWATRSIHEAFMCNHYTNCSFLTLTFNDDMLNRRENPHSVNKTAFRSWLKRLRFAIKEKYNREIRVIYCGEYGDKWKRPHYHMIVYGFNFPDKYVFKYNRVHGISCMYYRSPFLEEIWSPAHSKESFGFSVIGDVTFESSAYVARYIMKKQYGYMASKVYKDKEKEFFGASRMPGIGASYLDLYYKDIFNSGYIVLPNGNKTSIPRYYINRLENLDNELYNCYKLDRQNKMIENLFVENLEEARVRLLVREEFKKNRLLNLVRKYEFFQENLHNI